MARVTSIATAALVAGLVSGCGGGSSAAGAPTLTVSPGANAVYVGAPAVGVGALRSGGGADPISWTLDGPGTLSPTAGDFVQYTPPSTGDADAQATLTASSGALRSSATIVVHPRPFTLSPAAIRVTAGDGMIPIEVVPRDPTVAIAWSYGLDGPGSVDDWYAPPSVLFYPPASVGTSTTATIHVFALDGRYVVDALVFIDPPPGPGTNPAPPAPLSAPPAGFGKAVIVSGAVGEVGTMRGWADASSEGVILWGPTTYVEAAAWPREEGPADLTASCVANAWSAAWDSCSFHFTEMKLGDPIWDGQVGGTWYFHGTFEASMNGGRHRVKATF